MWQLQSLSSLLQHSGFNFHADARSVSHLDARSGPLKLAQITRRVASFVATVRRSTRGNLFTTRGESPTSIVDQKVASPKDFSKQHQTLQTLIKIVWVIRRDSAP